MEEKERFATGLPASKGCPWRSPRLRPRLYPGGLCSRARLLHKTSALEMQRERSHDGDPLVPPTPQSPPPTPHPAHTCVCMLVLEPGAHRTKLSSPAGWAGMSLIPTGRVGRWIDLGSDLGCRGSWSPNPSSLASWWVRDTD